ncbi:conserved protein of unknown function [Enterobacter cancerogenus]|uniref:DUF3296 domain-containing protein n=1 Tax=Enterobacter cancerogenus TaxID=69218 RepID=UPI0019263C43|nr:DUF3296 domain-containing protein [Enterobacter cancerogenus]CAD5358519.1 conserved protein of unknown function [Enterobacter cancerogenus]
MNLYPSATTAGNAAHVAHVRAFLKQAVDHYPRLAAFGFTLRLPCCENLADYQSLMLRFHTEVWQRTDEYSRNRQQARRHSPPTVLRWVWGATSAPVCRMALMMNLDTLGGGNNSQFNDNALQDMSEIICDAGQMASGVRYDAVTNMILLTISRSGRGGFSSPFNQLKAWIQVMDAPVSMVRTGIAG